MLEICRICFAKNTKFYHMDEFNLREHYDSVVGKSSDAEDGLPCYLCYECVHYINRYAEFRHQCLQSECLLNEINNSPELFGVEYEPRFTCTPVDVLMIEEYRHHDPSSQQQQQQYKVEQAEETVDDVSTKQEPGSPRHQQQDKKSKFVTIMLNNEQVKQIPLVYFNKTKLQLASQVEVQDLLQDMKTEEPDSNEEVEDEEMMEAGDDENTAAMCEEINTDSTYSVFEIVILSEEEQKAELKKKCDTQLYKSSQYKCQQCYKSYQNSDAFDTHMLQHDPSYGNFECGVCHLRFRTRHLYGIHARQLHKKKYICKLCNFSCTGLYKAKIHQEQHMGKNFECKDCGKVFSKYVAYTSHRRSIHPVQRYCPYCGLLFTTHNGLQRHAKNSHSDENKCDEQKLDPCEHCNTVFYNESAYKRHFYDIKNDTRASLDAFKKRELYSVKCGNCEVTYTSRNDYIEHRKTCLVRVGADLVFKKRMPIPNAEYDACIEKIKCPHCPFKAVSQAHLRQHVIVHTRERPFHCNQCPNKYASALQLRQHKHWHKGIKPYSCHVCDWTTAYKCNLMRHVRIHTGERPYQCDICEKRFVQSNSLKDHINTVHLKNPEYINRYRKAGRKRAALRRSNNAAAAASAARELNQREEDDQSVLEEDGGEYQQQRRRGDMEMSDEEEAIMSDDVKYEVVETEVTPDTLDTADEIYMNELGEVMLTKLDDKQYYCVVPDQ